MSVSANLVPMALNELTRRATLTPPDMKAATFLSLRSAANKGSKSPAMPAVPQIPSQAPLDESQMSEEDLVRDYFSDVEQPLTPEEHRQSQIRMKELEKIPYEELLRIQKEALGDLF